MLLNQTRLIKDPVILDQLEANANITPLQRSRIDEMRHHFLRAEPSAPRPARPTREDDLAAERGEAPPSAADGSASEAATMAAVTAETYFEEGDLPEGMMISDNALQQIRKMNTAQKIHLALCGSREARSLLLKVASRSV